MMCLWIVKSTTSLKTPDVIFVGGSNSFCGFMDLWTNNNNNKRDRLLNRSLRGSLVSLGSKITQSRGLCI